MQGVVKGWAACPQTAASCAEAIKAGNAAHMRMLAGAGAGAAPVMVVLPDNPVPREAPERMQSPSPTASKENEGGALGAPAAAAGIDGPATLAGDRHLGVYGSSGVAPAALGTLSGGCGARAEDAKLDGLLGPPQQVLLKTCR